MAKAAKKKSAKEASSLFHSIMQAAVKGNPKPKKKPHEVLIEIQENVKKLNKKYPVAFVRDGLEIQLRIGFQYVGEGRVLYYKVNPNWPIDIVKEVQKIVESKTAANNSIISGVVRDK
ncbi:MAG: hypothetical protein QM668_17900 [Agriterribacter sp.]